jgi:hypothetical protein
MQCELAMAFVIVSYSLRGVMAIVREKVAIIELLVTITGREANSLDPKLRS